MTISLKVYIGGILIPINGGSGVSRWSKPFESCGGLPVVLRRFELLRLVQEIHVWAGAVVDCWFRFSVSGESVVSCRLKQGIISVRALWWILSQFFCLSRVTPVGLLFQPLVDGWFDFWLRVSRASSIGRNKALSQCESCGGSPIVFSGDLSRSGWIKKQLFERVQSWIVDSDFWFWCIGRLLSSLNNKEQQLTFLSLLLQIAALHNQLDGVVLSSRSIQCHDDNNNND